MIVSIFIINSKNRKKQNLSEVSIDEFEEKIITGIIQDNETNEYIVYNKKTGEEIARSSDGSSLYIYTIDPNYNPKLSNTEEVIE